MKQVSLLVLHKETNCFGKLITLIFLHRLVTYWDKHQKDRRVCIDETSIGHSSAAVYLGLLTPAICRCSCFILHQSSYCLPIWLMSACVPSQNQRSIGKTEESILPCKKGYPDRSSKIRSKDQTHLFNHQTNDLAPQGFFHMVPGGSMEMGENSTIEGVKFRF